MSKTHYSDPPTKPIRLGVWLRQLRDARALTLRTVADAVDMDLAHLQKIELGLRVPTEQQASRLAKFFKLDEPEIQARRIAEKFQHEFADHPALKDAISMLAEESGVYNARRQKGSGRKKTAKQ